MAQTPKLDELATDIDRYGECGQIGMNTVSRIQLIEEALMEIRTILKTVRQKSLP